MKDLDNCYRLKLFLERFIVKSTVLNSELPQNSRNHIINQFNKGIFEYLIATDEKFFAGANRTFLSPFHSLPSLPPSLFLPLSSTLSLPLSLFLFLSSSLFLLLPYLPFPLPFIFIFFFSSLSSLQRNYPSLVSFLFRSCFSFP